MATPRIDLTAAAMLLGLAAVWGGSFVFAEIALRELGPMTITLHRVGWAAPLLFVLVRLKRLALPRGWRIWGSYLVMGALNNAIPFTLIFWGQTALEGGLASILNATTAVFGAVVAGLLLRDEPLLPRKLIGAALGVLGVAVVVGADALGTLSLRNLAQLAVLAAALSYALASVWARVRLGDQPPLVNAFGMIAGSTILMIPAALWSDGLPDLALAPATWAALAGLSLLSTVLAYLLYFAILRRAGAANLTLVTLLIPPFAIFLGWLVLGEALPASAWIGFAVIALGFLVTDGRAARALAARYFLHTVTKE
ncbi:DMT family transporter [Roseovarius nubinhibens]|nr:DMT family transporter [Roseovarius nubinhibens]MBU2999419.1 DMT family transporter [Roseovarius nubinhibens]